jgi:hypothetical protein
VKARTKKVSRIARLMEQQEEAMEMEVLQTRNQLLAEEALLADLKNELSGTLDNFEKRVQEGERIALQDVAFLYGVHHFLTLRIEKKREKVCLIEQELEVKQQLLLEAYQRKEVFGVFQNKMVRQDMRETDLTEQKSLDFLNLKNGTRQ